MRDSSESMQKVQCERKTVKDAQLLRLNDLPVSPNSVSALDVRGTVHRSRATAQHHFTTCYSALMSALNDRTTYSGIRICDLNVK